MAGRLKIWNASTASWDYVAIGNAPAGQIFLTASGMWPSATSGASGPIKNETSTGKQNFWSLSFVNGSTLSAEATVAMPSDWNAGTVTAAFYWTCTNASTNAVVWGCQGYSYGDNVLLDETWGTQVTVTDSNNAANVVNVSAATAAITITGAAASELVQFRVQRVTGGADTLAFPALLLGVMISFTRV